jgi:hypothetical protein
MDVQDHDTRDARAFDAYDVILDEGKSGSNHAWQCTLHKTALTEPHIIYPALSHFLFVSIGN